MIASMRISPRLRHAFVALACMAVLLHALAPLLTGRPVSRKPAILTEICTASAVKHASAKTHGASSHVPGKHSAMGGHCPFCLGHGAQPVLPSVAGIFP